MMVSCNVPDIRVIQTEFVLYVQWSNSLCVAGRSSIGNTLSDPSETTEREWFPAIFFLLPTSFPGREFKRPGPISGGAIG